MSTDKNYAYFKGQFVPLEEAKVSIMNHTFMYGTGVFEGVRGYWNAEHEQIYLFRLREHIERMMDSMKIMRLETEHTVDELCKLACELVRMNAPKKDIYLRPSAYKAGERIGPSLDNNPNDICMFTVPFGDYFHGAPGLRCMVSAWRRVEDNAIPARAKITGAYANTALAKTDALMSGYDEAIVLSENGHVSEGSAMNLFMVKRGILITTPITENILEGITRATVMEFAKNEFGFETVSRSIDRSELYTADELFFCGTGAQIAPIIEIDKRTLSNGQPGPITAKIKDMYQKICHGNAKQYSKWLTPVYAKDKAAVSSSK